MECTESWCMAVIFVALTVALTIQTPNSADGHVIIM